IVAHQCRQDIESVRLDNKLVMLGAKALGYLTGVGELVEVTLAKANRKCLDWRAAEFSHLGHDRTGVQATTEEGAERYVGDHATPDRIPQQRAELFDRLRLRNAQLLGEPNVPLRLDCDVTGLPD